MKEDFGKRKSVRLTEEDVEQLNLLHSTVIRAYKVCGKELGVKLPSDIPSKLDFPPDGEGMDAKGWMMMHQTMALQKHAIDLFALFKARFGWVYDIFDDTDRQGHPTNRVKLFFGKTRRAVSTIQDDFMDCVIYALAQMTDFCVQFVSKQP